MLPISIIIPTYNEAKNLPLLCEEIFGARQGGIVDAELIIVDDNSPDGTGDVAERLAARFPVRVIHRAGKLGLGSAVRAGFAASSRLYLGVMDADLSHDPAILNELITSLGEYDIAIGSRFLEGSEVEQWAWWRKLTSKAGVALARALTGVRDPLSGYFFLKRSVIENVSLTTVGYKILFEILIKGNYRRVKEIPYTFRVRQYSASKLNFKEYLMFVQQLVKYSWYKLASHRTAPTTQPILEKTKQPFSKVV